MLIKPPAGSPGRRGSGLTHLLRKLVVPTSLPFIGKDAEPPNEIRSNLLVASALIAAVTFQAGVAPPGGVWQDDEESRHVAGRAIYSSQPVAFHFFLICNTLAFSSSTYLLLCLTFGYPYFLEVLVAAVSMAGTYAAAIFCVTPYETTQFRFISLVAVLPIVIRPLIWSLSWTIGTIRRSFHSKHELGDEVPTAEKAETELT
ncbi:hypothetical protein CJ030_MR1G017997 [Morella rubra]|uniref:PGG domain-containing protein n=1 Tax=Morella rubra TaxID=262757 RepID=A0A6A1WQS3_9ROSI|nr:hypothetical protein CJ030_MR1G017997 [Morella rubra]